MRLALSLVLVVLMTSACDSLDDLLEVEPQDRVPSGTIEDPAQAELMVEGAVASFDCAFNAYVVIFGLIGDELANAQNNIAFQAYDKRDVSPSGGPNGIYAIGDCYLGGAVAAERFGIYKPVNSARWFADHALRMLEGWTDEQVPNRTALMARSATYSGFSHVLLGEGFCSAAIDGGPELTPDDVFRRGEEVFTRAIELSQQAGDPQLLSAARVGRARVRLKLGRGSDAVEDARLVPQGFVEEVTASNSTYLRYNRPHQFNNVQEFVTVAPGYRGMTFEGVPDPRVPVADAGKLGPDGVTPLWVQDRYPTLGSSIPLATWEEAQLIIAEVEGGQTAVDIINTLHARAGLPSFESAHTEEIRSLVLEERRRELFLQSHRIHDIIRFDLPLDPAPGTAFEGGLGGTYGSTTCLPLPAVERDQNPNIS